MDYANIPVTISLSREELDYIYKSIDVCLHDDDCGIDADKLASYLPYIQQCIDTSEAQCVFHDDDIWRIIAAADSLRRGVLAYNADGHKSAIDTDVLQGLAERLAAARAEARANAEASQQMAM